MKRVMLVLLAIFVVAGVAVAVTPKISLQAEDGVTTVSVSGGVNNDLPKTTTVEAFCNFTCTPAWTVIESSADVVSSDQSLPNFTGPEATFTALKPGTVHLVVRANNAIALLTLKVVE
jgi:biopolymer transport protein ExbD